MPDSEISSKEGTQWLGKLLASHSALQSIATPTSFAACSQSGSDVDAAPKYLSCLNNEQADAINRHADAINNLMDAVKTLEGNETEASAQNR